MKKYSYLFLIILVSVSSCVQDKIEHPVVGDYNCEKSESYIDNNGSSYSITEQALIEVRLENDSIDVIGAKIHSEQFEYSKTFSVSNGFNYMNFRFEPDSIYITLHYGASGSNSTTYYKGVKLN